MQIQVRAPANLLLVGEYVVTEPGGLGIAAAVQPELVVRLSPAQEFRADARTVEPLFEWRGGRPVPAAAGVVQACLEQYRVHSGDKGFPALHLDIDSSAFYGPDGSKRGLGSSAAVAAALCTGLFLYRHSACSGRSSVSSFGRLSPAERTTLLQQAVTAHRTAQGGGSAYDVTASLHGGLGMFRGGELPGWDPLPAEALPPASIRYGSAPVSSPGAVLGYAGFKARNLDIVTRHIEESNTETLKLTEALRHGRMLEFREGLLRLARAGVRLGELIGVPAEIEQQAGCYAKAVGAGNELALLFREDGCSYIDPEQQNQHALQIAPQGVHWCITE